ncbi:MAG: PKD domain-containing protein [candidate division Zixibacteria bacterium]|nr:PKD domain-containing protein [candidate division Zixibacteria bacterium]
MDRSYRLLFLIALVAVIALSSPVARAGQIWVAVDGSDYNGDGSYGYPYATISYALDSTSSTTPDTVFVKPGTYDEAFSFPTWAVALISEKGRDLTFIDMAAAGDSRISFWLGTPSTTLLDGFTISGAAFGAITIRGGDGILASPEIRYCTIHSNGADGGVQGGGIYMYYSQSNIHHNLFIGNTVSQAGGAIYCSDSSPMIWNNEFRGNRVLALQSGGGGAICVVGEILGSYTLIQNNLFLANQALGFRGGAAYLESFNLYFLNNLVYKNDAEFGGGIFVPYGFSAIIKYNIFMENTQYAIECEYATTPPVIEYNCFHLNLPQAEAPGSCNLDTVTNLIEVTPQLVNPGAEDFHLKATSPLIDACFDPAEPLLEVDYGDNKRIVYGSIDIGPFEWVDCDLHADFDISAAVVCTAQTVAFSDLSTGRWEIQYWNYGNSTGDTISWPIVGFTPQATYEVAGEYQVTLTAFTYCDTAIMQKTVQVIERPTADFSLLHDIAACAPLIVDFIDSSTGADLVYEWDFGDGEGSTDSAPLHAFADADTYLVTLIVSNDCGTDTTEKELIVIDVPAVDFTASNTSGSAPLTVDFSDNSTYSPNAWEWSFGDGGGSTDESPIYVYQVPGMYDVSLMAANACGWGTELLRQDYITVSGFDLALVAEDTTDKLQLLFEVEIDSLFAQFDRQVALSTLFAETPRRGYAAFTLSDDTVNVPDTITVTARLDTLLARGEYEFLIIGQAVGSQIVDTLPIMFRAWPDSLLHLEASTLDFDSVVIDSARIDTVKILNVGPFTQDLQKFILRITGVSSDNPIFVPIFPQGVELIPPNGGLLFLEMQFTPPDTGLYEGELTITSDDPARPEVFVSLVGVGIEERYPPIVVAVTPDSNENDIPIRTPVVLQISEPLDSASLDSASLTLYSTRLAAMLPGAVDLLVNQDIMRFVPADYYPPFDTITATLAATVTDLVGNSLDGDLDGIGSGASGDDFQYRFFTGPAVYPGDCNNDGLVNEIDILPIGVFYGLTGPSRDQFAENTTWGAKQALPWDDPRVVYADADGDGVVDENDVTIVATNWGSSHSWGEATLSIDFDYSDYADNLTRLRSAIEGMAGSEAGDRLLQTINTVTPGSMLPDEIMLLENYPNPFNPMTRIDYALPEGMEVHLTIHNILGQRVRILVAGYQQAGFKNIIWDGTDEHGVQVSSGVYFFKLETGTTVKIRKMVKVQ